MLAGMSTKPVLQDLIADFVEFANDKSIADADLADLFRRGTQWHGDAFRSQVGPVLKKAGRFEEACVFLRSQNVDPSKPPRVVSLNRVQALKPGNLLTPAVLQRIRGMSQSAGDMYQYALAIKIVDRDPKVMKALYELMGDTVLTNTGPQMEPYLPALKEALNDHGTDALVRHWAEGQVKKDHAQDPGRWKMHFGKHRGRRLDELPEGYVDWLQRIIPDFQAYISQHSARSKTGNLDLSGLRFPDLGNPNLPERYSRPPAGTFFDPVDMTRKFREVVKRNSYRREQPWSGVRFEDYSGANVADVPFEIRGRIEAFMETVARETFVAEFNQFVSMPETRERMKRWAEEQNARQDDSLIRKQAYEADLRARNVRPHAESKGRESLASPTSSEIRKARMEGRVIDETTSLHPGQLNEEITRRRTLEAYKTQTPSAVQGFVLANGGKVMGGQHPVLEDKYENPYLRRKVGFQGIMTWDRLLKAAELIERAQERGSSSDAERQVELALESVGGESELRRSKHPFAKELLKLADKTRNAVRARGRVAWNRSR
jgi:hypothetical protein